jgi:DNA-binding NarL/FixJ family response regulator
MKFISVVENSARHIEIITKHLQENPNYTILSIATNGFEFLEFCYSNKQLPDIALVDVEMNIMDGVTLVDFLHQFYPSIKCIAVTSHTHKEMVEDMMACGAMGIVFKFFTIDATLATPKIYGLQHKFESLDKAIETAMANAFYLDKLIEKDLGQTLAFLNREQLLQQCQQQRKANAVFNLTEREYEIAQLCAGTNARLDDIANMLCVSVQSLKLILAGVYKKVNVTDRNGLVFLCNRKGIVKNARNIVGKEKM